MNKVSQELFVIDELFSLCQRLSQSGLLNAQSKDIDASGRL